MQLTQTQKNLSWLLLTLIIIVFDQLTKHAALTHLVFNQPHAILPSLNFTLDFNTGASFGFLNQSSGWQNIFFTTIAIVVSGFILAWLYRLPPNNALTAMGLSLVLAGAMGNLIDRIHHGYVVDFISFYVRNWHFAIFNVADAAISVGAVLMLIAVLLKKN